MELQEGGKLSSFIKKRKQEKNPISTLEAASLLK
jgi:hypothetical protein